MPHALHRHRKSFVLIAFNLAIVLIVAGGTAAFGVLSKTVTLTIDGKQDIIRTFGDTVADVLAAKDITIRANDKVSPSPFSTLDGDQRIDVAYARPLTVTIDGTASKHTVYDETVGEALAGLGVTPGTGAYVSAKRSATLPRTGSEIVVSNTKSLTVIADGKKSTITTSAPTVAAVLENANVTLDANDEVKPGKDALVALDDEVRVVRIQKITKVETVSVKFPVEVRKDPEAAQGETKILTVGEKGENRQEVTLVVADGKVRERVVLSTDVISKPVTQIESRGTSTTPPDSVWDKIAKCESGGNWSINTGNGYYGGLQFSAATWRSVGGPGLPHQSSREVQIKFAKILQARSGWGQWGCADARFN